MVMMESVWMLVGVFSASSIVVMGAALSGVCGPCQKRKQQQQQKQLQSQGSKKATTIQVKPSGSCGSMDASISEPPSRPAMAAPSAPSSQPLPIAAPTTASLASTSANPKPSKRRGSSRRSVHPEDQRPQRRNSKRSSISRAGSSSRSASSAIALAATLMSNKDDDDCGISCGGGAPSPSQSAKKDQTRKPQVAMHSTDTDDCPVERAMASVLSQSSSKDSIGSPTLRAPRKASLNVARRSSLSNAPVRRVSNAQHSLSQTAPLPSTRTLGNAASQSGPTQRPVHLSRWRSAEDEEKPAVVRVEKPAGRRATVSVARAGAAKAPWNRRGSALMALRGELAAERVDPELLATPAAAAEEIASVPDMAAPAGVSPGKAVRGSRRLSVAMVHTTDPMLLAAATGRAKPMANGSRLSVSGSPAAKSTRPRRSSCLATSVTLPASLEVDSDGNDDDR